MYVRDGRGYCSRACAEWFGSDRRRVELPPPVATTGPEGVEPMITVESKDERSQASRWLEDGQRLLGVLLSVLTDYDRLREQAEATERDNERLRGLVYENEQLRNRLEASERECDRLRAELSIAQLEVERGYREREDVADRLTQVTNDLLVRLRPQRA
jgi:predicted RNase H-like nuclease (RuvC/YqgF family)